VRCASPLPIRGPRRAPFPNCLLLALALSGGGCEHEQDPPPAKAPTVQVEVAAVAEVVPRIPLAGVLAPLPGRDVKVGALVAGHVDRLLVAEGDPVKAGQPLAHVEALPARAHVAEVEAQQQQARAALENARIRQRRNETLFRDGVASKQDVEDARAAVVGAESALKQAMAAGGTASLGLERSTLRAPIDGVVAAVLVPAGQTVDGNGTPVVELADTRQLDLRAPVPAARVGEVNVGQRAALAVEGVGEVEGAVEAIAPLVDTATNTVTVRVRIANPHGRLRGGMFARGALYGAARRGLTVARGALLPGDGGAASTVAVVLADGSVAHRALLLGAEAGERIEVRGGLAAGERVIVAGGYALPDGTKVEIAK
jgi:RND family efflux transporter MFP subunit